MKMIWAVVRSNKVEATARALKKIEVSGCTVCPVRGYGEEWHLYEPLIHGGHHKLEAIVEDTQVDQVVKEITENGSTGFEGDGVLAVFELRDVVSIRTKAVFLHKQRTGQPGDNFTRMNISTGVFLSLLIFSIVGFLEMSTFVLAHEEGAPFSAAVIDPLEVHHAHLEDEQRLNLSFSKGFKRADGKKRFAFMNEYELAFAQDFTWGGEIFIPFSTGGVGRDYGVGDIEIQPLKWAFINQPETIATVVLAFTLPTGSKKRGLGEGNTVFAPNVFFDRGFGNWFVGLNLSPNVNIGGKQGFSFEYKSVLSYSFIWETERVAPTVPKQDWVWIPSLEFLGESVFRGEEKGKTFISILPGSTIWHTRSGWQLRTGVQIPTSNRREDDVRVLFQIGNHFDWAKLAGAFTGRTVSTGQSQP